MGPIKWLKRKNNRIKGDVFIELEVKNQYLQYFPLYMLIFAFEKHPLY